MNTKEIKQLINDSEKQGKIVISTLAGPLVVSLEDFCKQDAKGILYDLNRDEATTMLLADNDDYPRWVNDIATARVIKYLKLKLEQYENK